MADKIGRFISAKAEAKYLSAYDVVAAQWPVPSTDLDIKTSYGITRVRESGSGYGTPIVLLPGMPGNGLFWETVIADLSRDRVVYTIDPLGWAGRSEQTAPLRDEADIVAWLIEVFDGLGAERVHLAGYSMGSWLALLVGVRHSDRLASLTMLEPGGATFTKPKWSVLLKFLVGGIIPTRKRMEKFTEWLTPGLRHREEIWTMILGAIKFRIAMPWERPLSDEQLAAVTAPTMVLFGADTVANDPQVGAQRARDHLRGAVVDVYPGVGHEMLWAIPEQVIPRFLDFANRHDQVRA
ncbi:alpha/beta fold hydrolase [Nocardia sp. ET3-3]|uniref:Alpha/beta fold hydrolase n=1 Tax=Nocardia terrae TaxID=2675851 RepID=A0A7K1UU86_9NOCA|nr:alpha/beta hydrolase [Nocardia terrae]MVU77875.1 alpha/beta fold hydrolase [Nocardia terrae]